MRILVVDDHSLIRTGISSTLSSDASLTVCGEAVDGQDAIDKARELVPDLVVMDISMPRVNGLDATREIKRLLPGVEVLIVTQHDSPEMARQAFNAGASGYVVKSAISTTLLAAIAKIQQRGTFIHGVNLAGLNDNLDAQEILQRTAAFEKALRQSEWRFREMFDVLPVAIYTTDAEGRLTYFNPAAIQFSGRTPELGTDQWCVSWKLLRSDGTPMRHDECPMAIALKEGSIVDGVEAIAERPDGRRVWFTPYPRPLHDTEGRIVGGINMLVDITERKRVEQATGLLAAIVDSSDDAIISKNLDGTVTSWNKGAQRTFGYTAEEAVGQHITLIIPQDRLDEETHILEKLGRGERVEHFETVRVSKYGRSLDISVSISPVKDASGRVVGASKVARDITERKRLDQAMTERAQLLDLSNDAILVRDRDDCITYWNRSASELYGYSREEAMGRVTHQLLRTEFPEPLESIVQKLRRDNRWTGELMHRCKDGSQLVVMSRWVLDRDDSGNVKCVLETNNDITRQKENEKTLLDRDERLRILAEKLESEVRARTSELEQRNAENLQQSEQLRELSNRLFQMQDEERRRIARELHDSAGQIVTALGMKIAGIAQNVAHNPTLANATQESQELVQELSKEIRTMSYLLHPPLLDENGLLDAIRWYVQGLIERSGLNIDLDISENLGRLPSEMEMALFRIVQECLTNIHRHSGSNVAMIRLSRDTERVFLEVQDEGKGLSAEKLARIRAQRSGVGITGMQERVRHFKGVMTIQSNGCGMKVSCSLPLSMSPALEPEVIICEQASVATGSN